MKFREMFFFPPNVTKMNGGEGVVAIGRDFIGQPNCKED